MNPSFVNREKIITKFNLQDKSETFTKTSKLQNKQIKHNKDNNDVDYYNKVHSPFKTLLKKELNIPLKILSCLPTTILYDKNCCDYYKYYNKDVIDTNKPNFITNKNIQICTYKIVNRKFTAPFLLFLLYKDENDTYIFPNLKTSNDVFTTADSKLDLIYQNYKTKPEFIGYRETQHNIYLFYEDKEVFLLSNLSRNDKWWWVTIFEIMNNKKVLNFNIDRSVYSIFFKEPLLCNLYNNNNKYASGNVLYFGGSENYISFIASLGLPKESPTSNLGPYYYFYSYIGAGRRAIWTQSRKEEEYNDELITRNEYGVHKRGGLVRFILFGNTPKYFLNREDDIEDQSEISQERAKESAFIEATLKIRDVDANWATNYDIAYIGSTFISTDKEHKPRRLYAQWAAKDYYQYTSLTYHYVNTDKYIDLNDKEKALSAPYELANYDIE
jgi:hypothetical protein